MASPSNPPNTTCGNLLHDFSIVGADVTHDYLRVELSGLAVAFAISIHQLRGCHNILAARRGSPMQAGLAAPTFAGGSGGAFSSISNVHSLRGSLSGAHTARAAAAFTSVASRNQQGGSASVTATEIHRTPMPALLTRSVAASGRCCKLADTTTLWAVASHTATTVLLLLCFFCAAFYADAIRAAYVFFACSACVLGGAGARLLWLPVGFFSCAVLGRTRNATFVCTHAYVRC
jgi:hypothetical protein